MNGHEMAQRQRPLRLEKRTSSHCFKCHVTILPLRKGLKINSALQEAKVELAELLAEVDEARLHRRQELKALNQAGPLIKKKVLKSFVTVACFPFQGRRSH